MIPVDPDEAALTYPDRREPTAGRVIESQSRWTTERLQVAFAWRGESRSKMREQDQRDMTRQFVRLAELALALCPLSDPSVMLEALIAARHELGAQLRDHP